MCTKIIVLVCHGSWVWKSAQPDAVAQDRTPVWSKWVMEGQRPGWECNLKQTPQHEKAGHTCCSYLGHASCTTVGLARLSTTPVHRGPRRTPQGEEGGLVTSNIPGSPLFQALHYLHSKSPIANTKLFIWNLQANGNLGLHKNWIWHQNQNQRQNLGGGLGQQLSNHFQGNKSSSLLSGWCSQV